MKAIPSYVQVVRNCWIMPTADLTAAVTAKKNHLQEMPYSLLSARDEGRNQEGHALVGAKDDTLSSHCHHQAFATRDKMNIKTGSSQTD